MLWLGQLAWYRSASQIVYGTSPVAHIVAVETRPPHVVTVFKLTPAALDLGTRTWRLLWERLMVCERTDSWPGYVEDIAQLDVPEDEALSLEMEGEEVML